MSVICRPFYGSYIQYRHEAVAEIAHWVNDQPDSPAWRQPFLGFPVGNGSGLWFRWHCRQ
jgi:hypothetical protein